MRKRTEEETKEIVESLGYVYVDSYFFNSGSRDHRKVIIKDEKGYKYDVFLYCILDGQGVRFVDKSNPFSIENISLWLKLNNSQFILLENNEYKTNSAKLNLYCNKCKDYLKMSWNKILDGGGCGVCKGLQIGENHNLAIQRPDIAKEWHPTLNGDLTPYDVTYGSKRKVWWICPTGHSYFSEISTRTIGKSGCKICSDELRESSLATRIKNILKESYNSISEYKIFKNPETGYWLPYDIYIPYGENPEINGVYIEVHWEQHYKLSYFHKMSAKKNNTTPEEEFEYQKHKDRLKRRFARKNGIYIEIDLRKIKTTEDAIKYIENILEQTLSKLG